MATETMTLKQKIRAANLRFTQAELSAMAAAGGYGCKNCDMPVAEGDWYRASGDSYGICCLPLLRELRAGAVKAPAEH